MHESLMRQCREQMRVSLDDGQMEQLATYDGLLQRYNPEIKMCKAEGDDFIIRHYADSLVGVPLLAQVASHYHNPAIADLGSGAGLPGIPLAIALPHYRFVLIERMHKRADFLRLAVDACKLGNVSVLEQRLVEVKKRFTIVTCRAFHPFYDIEREVDSVLAEGGTLMLYKGRSETIREELDQVKGGWRFAVHPVTVPMLDAERALVIGTRKL